MEIKVKEERESKIKMNERGRGTRKLLKEGGYDCNSRKKEGGKG